MNSDRPRFRVSADRHASSRRVRYGETNRPDSQNCAICQLDEENSSPIEAPPARRNLAPSRNDPDRSSK